MINRKTVLGMGLLVLLLVFMPICSVYAESPSLKQLMAQLQKNPDDLVLREKIIKKVHSMKSKPSSPDGLAGLMGKVKYIMANGTSQDDFVTAAEAYKEAALLAPWNADVYYNLGKIEEKAGLFQEALVSYSLYLIANSKAADQTAIKEKVGAMEYASGTTFEVLENPPKFEVLLSKEGMVLIPAGEFWMGAPDGMGREDEHPRHKVSLGAFYIDRFLVTNRQFKEFVDATRYVTDKEKADGNNEKWKRWEWTDPQGDDSGIQDKMDNPVVFVDWNDAQAYANWAGKRLPTEAEWEKAERGGTDTNYFWGNNFAPAVDYCWIDENAGDVIHKVGLKKPNAFGLYDMVGNVNEWCSDWYGENYYSVSPENNPTGPNDGKDRVVRGFSYRAKKDWMGAGSTYRSPFNPKGDYQGYLGFRCVKDVKPEATSTGVQDDSGKKNQ